VLAFGSRLNEVIPGCAKESEENMYPLSLNHRLMRVLILLYVVFLAGGCGPSTGTVTGKVRYNGKPLSSGSVSFLPESGRGSFGARIKEDGSYTIEKVPVGKVKIVVNLGKSRGNNPRRAMMHQAMKSNKVELSEEARKSMPSTFKDAAESPQPSAWVTSIPKRYSDPDQSGLELTVTGGQQTHDIELK
jgi:hypothetical protein